MSATSLNRDGKILTRKFMHYLIPAVFCAMALSIDDFVDSLISANLINSDAMAVINLAHPITLFTAAIYCMLGVGGSVVYAQFLGRKKTHKAARCLTLTLLIALATGIVLSVIGLTFTDQIAQFLGADKALHADLCSYLRPFFISMPLLVFVLTFTGFLPAIGFPGISSAITIIANAVNLVGDLFFIGVLKTGVAGTVYATFCGYAIGLIVIIVFLIVKRRSVSFGRFKADTPGMIPKVLAAGLPAAFAQVGFAVCIAFCNKTAAELGGTPAVVAYSLQGQMQALVSIMLSGILDATLPIVSLLYGQRDSKGIKLIMTFAGVLNFGVSILFTAIFELFPELLLAIFDITDPATAVLCIHAIRILSITYLLRTTAVLFRNYLSAVSHNTYSFLICLYDTMVGIIGWTLILKPTLGLNALWWSYPICAGTLLIGILIANSIIFFCRRDKYSNLLLVEKDNDCAAQLDTTVSLTNENISTISETAVRFCREQSLGEHICYVCGLAIEEMALYTLQHKKDADRQDVLLRLYRDRFEIDFRSIGVPFDPLGFDEETDIPENVKLLQGITDKLEYTYAMGMNSTKVTIFLKQTAPVCEEALS